MIYDMLTSKELQKSEEAVSRVHRRGKHHSQLLLPSCDISQKRQQHQGLRLDNDNNNNNKHTYKDKSRHQETMEDKAHVHLAQGTLSGINTFIWKPTTRHTPLRHVPNIHKRLTKTRQAGSTADRRNHFDGGSIESGTGKHSCVLGKE